LFVRRASLFQFSADRQDFDFAIPTSRSTPSRESAISIRRMVRARAFFRASEATVADIDQQAADIGLDALEQFDRAACAPGGRQSAAADQRRLEQRDADLVKPLVVAGVADAARSISASTTARPASHAISPAAIGASISNTSCGVSIARPAA
jgi:hypothetical protein